MLNQPFSAYTDFPKKKSTLVLSCTLNLVTCFGQVHFVPQFTRGLAIHKSKNFYIYYNIQTDR